MGKKLRIGLLGLLLCSCLQAETRLGRGVFYDGPWWSFMRVGMIGAAQRSVKTNTTYFGEFSLNPWLAVTEWFAFRGNFGITALKNAQRENFVVTEYQLFFSFADIFGVTVEPGFGAQTWWKNGDSHLLVSFNLLFPVDEPSLAWFRYLYVGYSGFFLPGLYTHQAKIGIEVTLW